MGIRLAIAVTPVSSLALVTLLSLSPPPSPQAKLSMMHSGWKTLMVTEDEQCSVLRVELKGVQNNIRVRQVQVLSCPSKALDSTCLAVFAQQKACESEALRVFRLLTSQVRAVPAFDCLVYIPCSHYTPVIQIRI